MSHNLEKNEFTELLKQNEDDLVTRLVYADWLEENGYCEEAERHRLWNDAKKWMVDFSNRCKSEIHAKWKSWANSESEFEEWVRDGDNGPMSYQELIDLGKAAYDEADRDNNGEITDLTTFCGDRESMMEHLMRERRDFWNNWSIITGNPLPDKFENLAYFRCAC